MDQALRGELRDILHRRISELETGSSGDGLRSEAVELDQARVGRLSRMDAMQQQAMLDATRIRNEQQLSRLRLTLNRIDTEDYGFCEDCDESIAPGRLRIDPAATRCVGCAGKA